MLAITAIIGVLVITTVEGQAPDPASLALMGKEKAEQVKKDCRK